MYNLKVSTKTDGSTGDVCVYFFRDTDILFKGCYCLGTSTTQGLGAFCNEVSTGQFRAINVSNMKYGLSSHNSRVLSRNNADTGTMPLYGLWAAYAGVFGKYDATQPDGSTADELVQYGGTIR